MSGWEGVDWYAPDDVEPIVERLSWGRENWFPYWRAEHVAARNGVVLMDMSFMSKRRKWGTSGRRNKLGMRERLSWPGTLSKIRHASSHYS